MRIWWGSQGRDQGISEDRDLVSAGDPCVSDRRIGSNQASRIQKAGSALVTPLDRHAVANAVLAGVVGADALQTEVMTAEARSTLKVDSNSILCRGSPCNC